MRLFDQEQRSIRDVAKIAGAKGRAPAQSQGACSRPEREVAPMLRKETEKRRSENVIGVDQSGLLGIHCEDIAPFETPTFGKRVGELIARAASTPQKPVTSQGQTRKSKVGRS